LLEHIWQWIPYLTGKKRLDAWLFGGALASLLALLYYVLVHQ
jgi:protein phosphatase